MRAESSDGSNTLKKKVLKNAWNLPKVNFSYKLFLVLTRIIFKKSKPTFGTHLHVNNILPWFYFKRSMYFFVQISVNPQAHELLQPPGDYIIWCLRTGPPPFPSPNPRIVSRCRFRIYCVGAGTYIRPWWVYIQNMTIDPRDFTLFCH